jgi:glycosyltransferase involved in cell wall biosynthesis
MAKLLIVQRRLTHYRVPFFEVLRDLLSRRGISLTVGHGCGTAHEESKEDCGFLPWADRIETSYFLGGRVCYQPFGHLASNADMLVVTAENKLINNLPYQYGHASLRVGLWGHGANLQGNGKSLREVFKRRVARRCDWWFGYTEMSRSLIRSSGFPDERITILNNSVDTSSMELVFAGLAQEDHLLWRSRHGIGSGPVGIFVGSLYAEKRIDLLLESASRLRSQLPGFELVVVGAGPLQEAVSRFSSTRPWVHHLGALHGEEKVRALAASDVLLNPGAVGLGVLDSFVCGIPMITLSAARHGPEFSYLKDGINGVVIDGGIDELVDATRSLLLSADRYSAMSSACLQSARSFSITNMAERFAEGVSSCLDAPVIRGGGLK